MFHQRLLALTLDALPSRAAAAPSPAETTAPLLPRGTSAGPPRRRPPAPAPGRRPGRRQSAWRRRAGRQGGDQAAGLAADPDRLADGVQPRFVGAAVPAIPDVGVAVGAVQRHDRVVLDAFGHAGDPLRAERQTRSARPGVAPCRDDGERARGGPRRTPGSSTVCQHGRQRSALRAAGWCSPGEWPGSARHSVGSSRRPSARGKGLRGVQPPGSSRPPRRASAADVGRSTRPAARTFRAPCTRPAPGPAPRDRRRPPRDGGGDRDGPRVALRGRSRGACRGGTGRRNPGGRDATDRGP